MDVEKIVEHVKANMLGRIADEKNNTALMAETTLCDGDHLEIGTLHGGSAIVVALLKRTRGYSGKVVCIDPLDGYYIGTRYACKNDIVTDVPITLETLRENEQIFGVELEVVRARSIPFPIHGRRFATAYIDGDHWGDSPTIDFINAALVTSEYITFDNCDRNHPEVVHACEIAERVWIPHRREGNTCIVRRP